MSGQILVAVCTFHVNVKNVNVICLPTKHLGALKT